jgi:hypothetical protein
VSDGAGEWSLTSNLRPATRFQVGIESQSDTYSNSRDRAADSLWHSLKLSESETDAPTVSLCSCRQNYHRKEICCRFCVYFFWWPMIPKTIDIPSKFMLISMRLMPEKNICLSAISSGLELAQALCTPSWHSGHFHFSSLIQCPDEIWHNSTGIPAVPFKEPLPAYSPSTQLSSGSITFGLNVTMPWMQWKQ